MELNVIEQVHNLAQTSTDPACLGGAKVPELHGWVYGLKDGIIREIAHWMPSTPLDPLYEYDLDPWPDCTSSPQS